MLELKVACHRADRFGWLGPGSRVAGSEWPLSAHLAIGARVGEGRQSLPAAVIPFAGGPSATGQPEKNRHGHAAAGPPLDSGNAYRRPAPPVSAIRGHLLARGHRAKLDPIGDNRAAHRSFRSLAALP